MEVYTMFGVPDEIIPEVRKSFANEKNTDFEIDVVNSSTKPYYPFEDPRSTPQKFTFQGKDYLVYRTTPGVKMNWCFDHM